MMKTNMNEKRIFRRRSGMDILLQYAVVAEWQTRRFQEPVERSVRVQVPPTAPDVFS